MSVDDLVIPSSDSFWEVGKFMRTVKRCDNGYKLCDHLRQLIESRSEIEKNYAKSLAQWSKKWNDFLDRGPEYGTTQAVWRSALCESDSLSDLHSEMGDKLMSEVYASIKLWQKENYHKSMMHFKETKDMEDGFRKAQKPWNKRLTKVMNAKKEYHSACRQEKSTSNQENNARGDSAVSPDQLKRLQEKLRKLQSDVEATRDKFQAALNDLNSYNAKYMEDMTEVFEKSQEFEKKRIEFFKKTFFQMHTCLDLSVEARFAKIYTDFHSTISNTDAEKDLKWWSSNHGVDMAMNWPTFEEYSPELQSISRRGKSHVGSSDGITITRIKHTRESSYENYASEQPPSYNAVSETSYGGATSSTTVVHGISGPAGSYDNNGANPFDDGDVEDDHFAGVETASSQGYAVRALYDYEKSEDDELSFKAGDVFVQLVDEDEMGWCKGRKDGVEGLYPANYAERL